MSHVGNSSMSMCHLSEMNAEKGDSEVSSGPVGSIKKTVGKVTSKGLIELPPEPGAVKFECQGISWPSSSRAFRGGSAGRVERSLQLARKKELVDEIPTRCNSAGAEMISLGKIKHSKQIQEMENLLRRTGKVPNGEDNSGSDSSSSSSSSSEDIQEGNDHRAADQIINTEPLDELKAEFLTTVMDENYAKAKELCQKILLLEPDNKLCSEFHAVIVEKIQQGLLLKPILLCYKLHIKNLEGETRCPSSVGSRAVNKIHREDTVQDAVAAEDSEDDDEGDEEDDNCEEGTDSDDDGEESNDADSDDDEEDDEESDSDDDYSTPAGPINLIMGGLPIKSQSR